MENNNLSAEQLNQIVALLNDNGIKIDKESKQEEWTSNLKTNKYGYLPTIMNYKLWLKNASKYTNKVKYNSFFDFIEFNGRMIEDKEEDFLYEAAEEFFDHNISRPNLKTAFNNYAYENSYNPITEYLLNLNGKWDGKERLETFIIDALEAEDNKLNRFFTKTWMIGAVKRAFQPGCQFDAVLALQGGIQGSGKTTLFRRIALEKYYKTFAAGEFKNKDSIDKMNKSWITMLDEFDKYSDAEVADMKSKITEKVMACRKSYGHNTTEFKVHWVFAATTNSDNFLCDLTGDEFERRYWIIECKKNTVDGKVGELLTDEFVEQLWAEAVECYFGDEDQELFLSSKNPLYEEYKNYQIKFKKTANNPALDWLDDILNNRKYFVDGNGCFKNPLDMCKQYERDDIELNSKYINKVPCSYICTILKNVYKVDYKPKYIKSLLIQMGGEWEMKQSVRYNGKVVSNTLCRTNEIKNEKVTDDNDLFFV